MVETSPKSQILKGCQAASLPFPTIAKYYHLYYLNPKNRV